jgi:putative ABC transport system permease protein
VSTFLQDIRYSLRLLMKSPGFTLVAILTLALGIGANTAIFSVVNAVLMQPLPYQDSGRLVTIWNDYGSGGQSLPAVSAPDFRDYQQRTTKFADLAAAAGSFGTAVDFGNTEGDEKPQQITVAFVTPNFFPLLGVNPVLGRQFTPEEGRPNGPALVMLSYGFWQRRFGGDPSVIGKAVRANRQDITIAGVLPKGFQLQLPAEALLLRDSELWRPMQIPFERFPRNLTNLAVFGRLKPDATLAQAQSEMDGIAEQLRSEHEVHRTSGLRIRVVPMQYDIVKNARQSLLILFGAVGLVLLIACANVANLLMARAASREREVAVRAALGAGRGRLIRQVLTEALVLAMLGGIAGVWVGSLALQLLLRLHPANLPRLSEVHLNWTVLAFTFLACTITGILFGLIPALQLGRPNLADVMKEGAKSSAGSAHSKLRRLLVVSEIALSLMLLLGAGLLIRSFFLLEQAKPGYETAHALTLQINIPGPRYPKFEDLFRFTRQFLDEIRKIPSVQAVGGINRLPLTGSGPQTPYAYDDATAQAWESISADWRIVTPGYFEATGMELAAGRFFTDQDDTNHPFVTVIDESLAQRAWPNQNPIGKRLQIMYFGQNAQPGVDRIWTQVIGVIKHPRIHDLTRDVREQVYVCTYQQPAGQLGLFVRSTGDPAVLAKSVEDVLRRIDSGIPLHDVRVMDDFVSDALAPRRFSLILLLVFGGVAVALTVVGLYGLIAYSVSQRTQELGIRIAMGATPSAVLRMVVGEGLKLTAFGIVSGLVGALLLSRALASLLYGVSSTDPLTYATGAIALAVVGLAACYIPARRATKVDPIIALRYQ